MRNEEEKYMIKNLMSKYRELITYVFFGGCTTIVNLVVFKLSNMILSTEYYLISNAIAWVVSVIFAYITNKLWVFESKSWNAKILAKEIPSFVSARVFSFVIEELGLFALIDLIGFNAYSVDILTFHFGGEIIAKVILAVIVVMLNYILSKFIIFKKTKNNKVQCAE